MSVGIICLPVSHWPKPPTESDKEPCCQCGKEVWVAKSTPPHDKVMCVHCYVDHQEWRREKLQGPTPEQLADIRAHT